MAESNPSLTGRALILGASSGFGAAITRKLASAGCDIVGVHLDRRITLPAARVVEQAVRRAGREAWFYNVNAADENRRDQVLDDLVQRAAAHAQPATVRVVVHSLAFGSLLPLLGPDDESRTSLRQLEMTSLVMAHSLVTWIQGLVARGLLQNGGRVFALTSTGAWSVWPGYGAVSSAKAALEAHVRQLAVELAPLGVTVNALCPGVTDTPALRKIPAHEKMVEIALRRNPHDRLTHPDDVASALVALCRPETYWLTGNVINVDGGEGIVG
jgi:NAD(P)-dependent dehydrogenase (short-subunit alcohol dehydrogenase family)